MTVHLFLGGPIHLQSRDLPWGTPRHWDVPILPEMPLVGFTAQDELIPAEEIAIDRFTYVPMKVQQDLGRATVYVPADLSQEDRWEVVKMHGLGQIPEG